jgi:hypothetical protein
MSIIKDLGSSLDRSSFSPSFSDFLVLNLVMIDDHLLIVVVQYLNEQQLVYHSQFNSFSILFDFDGESMKDLGDKTAVVDTDDVEDDGKI